MPTLETRWKKIGVAIVLVDGHVIVGERQPGQSFSGLAEFPGGKVEAGEDFATAACRECLEETGLAVEAVRQLDSWEHVKVADDGATEIFRIEFWECRPSGDITPQLDAVLEGAFRWVPLSTLPGLKFPSANTRILSTLISRHPQD
jgi:8-oxo-dGTP diphosphatase